MSLKVNASRFSDTISSSENRKIKSNLEHKLEKSLYNMFSDNSDFSPGFDCAPLARKVSEFAGDQAVKKSESAYKWVIIKDHASESLKYYLQTDECLGKGTYGEVYRGFTHDGIPCAIKRGNAKDVEFESLQELSIDWAPFSNAGHILAADLDDGIIVIGFADTDLKQAKSSLSDTTSISENRKIIRNLEHKLDRALYNMFSDDSEFSPDFDCAPLAKKISEFAGDRAVEKTGSAYKWVIIKGHNSESLKYYLQTDELLGKGTYGEVYRGFTHDGIPCAIKFGRIKDVELESLQELSAKCSRRSNVCQLLAADLGEGIGDGIIVMELADTDLKKAKSSLTEKELRILFRGILSAMNEIASNKITHSDLKPANILLMKREDYFSAKIGDFGLSIKNSGEFSAGTRWYYSPEIFRYLSLNEEISPDQIPKIDIWAAMMVFAEVGYDMLSLEFQDRFNEYTDILRFEMDEAVSKKEFLRNMALEFKKGGSYSGSDGLFSDLEAQTPLDSLIQAMAMINPDKRIAAQEALNLFDGLFTSRPPSSPDLDISDEFSSEDLLSKSDF
ncbi:MAG: serine/threonine-protein kinase [Verrucomicrobia bacterium]|nr:serine/threonine-protein kinase [Verrucomicrobiota bacterium]